MDGLILATILSGLLLAVVGLLYGPAEVRLTTSLLVSECARATEHRPTRAQARFSDPLIGSPPMPFSARCRVAKDPRVI